MFQSVSRNEVAMAFGRVLRRHRKLQGLSQEEMAKEARMDRTYPSLMERGLRSPTITIVMHLAAVLRCSSFQLMEDTVKECRIIRRQERKAAAESTQHAAAH